MHVHIIPNDPKQNQLSEPFYCPLIHQFKCIQTWEWISIKIIFRSKQVGCGHCPRMYNRGDSCIPPVLFILWNWTLYIQCYFLQTLEMLTLYVQCSIIGMTVHDEPKRTWRRPTCLKTWKMMSLTTASCHVTKTSCNLGWHINLKPKT